MPKYKHMPNHPYANERGVVEVNERFYEGLYLMGALGEDKRMMRGNEPVVINYIPDGMEPTRHMALPLGSAPIDSKSKFRKVTKEHNSIEVGNETEHLLKPRKRIKLDRRQRREDMRKAYRQVRDNNSEVLYEQRNRPNYKYKDANPFKS